jgi:hypothetical protein
MEEVAMKTIRFAAAIISLLVMSACVPLPSLNPLWDEGHAVSEPALAGTWISDDDNEIITIAESDRNGYRMTYIDDDSASRYEVHAVRLEGRLFLDLYPDGDALEKRLKGEVYLPLIPTHFFLRAVLEGDRLELAALDDEGIANKLERGEIEVPLLKLEDGVLLTAQTDRIQDLVVRFVDDPDLWSDTELYHRCCGK